MKLKNSKMDIAMEIICFAALVGMTAFLVSEWSGMPEKIPMHYDWAGNIDRWGKKSELLFLPIMTWGLYAFITFLEQIPQIWNTGVTVTEENKVRVYRVLKYMIKTLKLFFVLSFVYMVFHSVTMTNLPTWFTWVSILGPIVLIVFWIVRLLQVK